jgi:hypothetical protein
VQDWTRRRFLESMAASGLLSTSPLSAEWIAATSQQTHGQPRSQGGSPEIISGRLLPLLESNVERPLRYRPERGGFTIENGSQFFNRPIYGPNIPFRVDGGDLPEFSLYLPGHGGNLRLAVVSRDHGSAQWLHALQQVKMVSFEGRLRYELADAMLGEHGVLIVEAITCGAALWVEISARDVADGLLLGWAFGGVSGRKGKRNGDIGCEDEPVSQFFQLRPEESADNRWTLPSARDGQNAATVHAGKISLRIESTAATTWKLGEAAAWNAGWSELWRSAAESSSQPILLGLTPLPTQPLHLAVTVLEGALLPAIASQSLSAASFAQRRDELTSIARRMHWRTPDAYFDSVAQSLGISSDALWDAAQGCVMHGAVAWRVPLAGWRGPYSLDVMGDHERMRLHLRHWMARQNIDAVTNGSGGSASAQGFVDVHEAQGTPDAGSHLARTEKLLHSAGDVSHNHYDMNLVFFDALLRHLRWTGDLAFAREAWPALERHAAWERRLFRRDYGVSGEAAPLYEAYAAIWASDNLQYNGGGSAHSSAYNAFLHRSMAELAGQLALPDEVSAAYRTEAEAIVRAMRKHLWMRERGALAESREWLGERYLAEDPALWTVYQAIDSEVVSERESWQMAAERLRALRKVPVRGAGVPQDAGSLLACSDWHPYVWSLTLLVLAENLAMALALFQAAMADEAWDLLRGSLLDAGFRGLCPGNFPMSMQLDPHRQESQRDFGDPIGCAARAIVEGLWGVQPRLLDGQLFLRPQLPSAWEHATFEHPELTIAYHRAAQLERWTVATRLPGTPKLTLHVRSRAQVMPRVVVNGEPVQAHFFEDAIGVPQLLVKDLSAAPQWVVELYWVEESPVVRSTTVVAARVGEVVVWPAHVQHRVIDDPQGCLQQGVAVLDGGHTVFLQQQLGDCSYWLPVELQIAPRAGLRALPLHRSVRSTGAVEHVPLEAHCNGRVQDILTRDYRAPRSPFCSLNLPDTLLGGWANFDSKAVIDDRGLRALGGLLTVDATLSFALPAVAQGRNCCYLSQWAIDKPSLRVPLRGRARRAHLLLAATTFPQATRSTHAELKVDYTTGAPQLVGLSSPTTWWPVEQDYMVDDYIFRIEEDPHAAAVVDWRVDLRSGRARRVDLDALRATGGGRIEGGSGFVVSVELDPTRELAGLQLHARLYGIVLAWMGLSIERA